MATFRIHEDQENRGISEHRFKQNPGAPLGQKRAVLGALENHSDRNNKIKGKQPLGASKIKENLPLKQIIQNIPPPVVPVAQFEAFKVYEDGKENEKPRAIKAKVEPTKPLEEKKEWFAKEHDVKSKEDKHEQDDYKSVSSSPESDIDVENVIPNSPVEKPPMSIHKPVSEPRFTITSRSNKDLFFENEEYRSEIYVYLREHELRNRPKPGYMRKQPDITYNMRAILVDWLVEVAEEYKLQSETLYLAINYIDRFLSYMSVVRGKLQLVGTAAMFIAAKYEEIITPLVKEFVYITDDTYTKKQVIRMEQLILKVLAFDLSVPTPLTFITAIAITTRLPEKMMYLAMFLSELSMLEADSYLETLPSVLASAAIAVARYTFKLEPWSAELQRTTGYDIKDLRNTMKFLYLLFCRAPTHAQQAIQEKYKSSKFMHVSQLLPRSEDILIE